MLIANPVNPESNSFVDLPYANNYLSKRIGTDKWDVLKSDEAKEKYLIWSSFVITQSFIWEGYKKISGQELAFPRTMLPWNKEEIVDGYPRSIKIACVELSLWFLNNHDEINTHAVDNTTNVSIGNISVSKSVKSGKGIKTDFQVPSSIQAMFVDYVQDNKILINPPFRVVKIER